MFGEANAITAYWGGTGCNADSAMMVVEGWGVERRKTRNEKMRKSRNFWERGHLITFTPRENAASTNKDERYWP